MIVPGTTQKLTATPEQVMGEWQYRAPDYADFIFAKAAQGFEHTTTSVALTEGLIQREEEKAYGMYAPTQRASGVHSERHYELSPNLFPPATGVRPEYIAKEDWNEKHPLYRKGVAWQEHMTPVRAKYYAEDYDKREFRQMLIERGEDAFGFWGGSVPGFFAGMLGNLPDPINVIPFGRGLTAGKGVMAGIKTGMVEGALANAAVDLVVLPDLARRGADVGFADFALDVAFGSLLGGGLGGVGGGVGRWRDVRAARQYERTNGAFYEVGRDRFLEGAGRNGGRTEPVWELLGPDETPASRGEKAPPVFEYKETPGGPVWEESTAAGDPSGLPARNNFLDFARRNLHGEDRRALLAAFDAALDDFTAGRPVDVGPILGESTALARLYEQALFHPLWAADPHSPQVRLMYAALADELGVRLGDVYVDIGTGRFNARGRMEIARETSFGLVKFIWKHGEGSAEPRKMRVTKEDIVNFPQLLRKYAPDLHEQGGYRWVVQASDGRILRYVAKNFTGADGKSHLVTVHVITKGQAKRDGLSKKIADLVSSQEGLLPSREIPRGALTNQAFAPSRASLGQESATHRSGGYSIAPTNAEVKAFDPFAIEISDNSPHLPGGRDALPPTAPAPNTPITSDALSPAARFLDNTLRELGIPPEYGPAGAPRPDGLPALPPGPAADTVNRALELIEKGEAHPAYAGEFKRIFASAISGDGSRGSAITSQGARGSDAGNRPQSTSQGAGASNGSPSAGHGVTASRTYGELPPLSVNTKALKPTADIDKTLQALSEHCSSFSKHGRIIRIAKGNLPEGWFMATSPSGAIRISSQAVFLGPTIGTHDLSEILHIGWNRLAKGKPLTLEQEAAMQILWHEMLHQRQYGLIWNQGRFSKKYEKILEVMVEWTARRTYGQFLATLGIESGFQPSIKRYGQGYYRGVNNFGILLRMSGVKEDRLTASMLHMIEYIPEDAWCKNVAEMISKENQNIKKDDTVDLLKSLYDHNFLTLLK